MSTERLFRLLSYLTVFCGFFSLWVGGAIGPVGTGLFLVMMIVAWFLEDSSWQISERLGTALIVLAIPFYYGLWRLGFFSYSSTDSMLPGILARLILSLSAIKLLQQKGDRDWIFLYVMGFCELLLAAGLSISAMYLLAFVMYAFSMVCTIVLFEMRKTGRAVWERAYKKADEQPSELKMAGFRRIPATAVFLILLITLIAAPLFYAIPRVGGAGLGSDPSGGVSTRSGFSDTVELGGIGRIQQSDGVVMRVRLEGADTIGNLKWRGLALDTFNGKAWSKYRPNAKEPRAKNDNGLIQVDFATGKESLLLQTFYMEPLDTPVIFAAPRAVGIQGSFPVVFKDLYGGITFSRSGDRVSYKVLSDTSLPSDKVLREDREEYPSGIENYLQLPEVIDPRIAELAATITRDSHNRYDAAVAIESYLQNEFGYTLEQKAGGPDPLADFLFNVREGHCEYFATAMVLMMRSQGIATRLVTGFQQGEYNETADVFVVRQNQAHAWVEVYFPGEKQWVAFDPTPAASATETGAVAGFSKRVTKYMEALEMFWIQYFVAFDNQEQRTLFTSVRRNIQDAQSSTTSWLQSAQTLFNEWWKDVKGENGGDTRMAAIGYGAGVVSALAVALMLAILLFRKLRKMKLWQRLRGMFAKRPETQIIEFYERMVSVLAGRGLLRESHQTPAEFATQTGFPEAVKLTGKYNDVRFGKEDLTASERDAIEAWLGTLSAKG